MKTLNYKNVIVVAKNNCALVSNNKREYSTVMDCTDNIVASLQAMKVFLDKVPTNSELVEEPYQLVLGEKSAIKGFATGTHLQYIRTGANATGKEFTDEQMTLIKEVAFLLAERSLNIKVTTDKFISYKDKESRAVIDFAWKSLDKELAKQTASTKPQRPQRPVTQAPVVDITKDSLLIKLQAKMDKALDEDDDEAYDKFEERYNRRLAQLQGQTAQAPVVEETNEVEVPEDNQEEDYSELDFSGDEDPTAGSDEIDL